jgi:hypothetical protein
MFKEVMNDLWLARISSLSNEVGLYVVYTTLPRDKLKTRLKETIHKTFSHRNCGSKFVVLGYNSTYFSNKIHKGDLLKQCPSKGDKYVIDEELQHTDHLFLGVACFTFMNFV